MALARELTSVRCGWTSSIWHGYSIRAELNTLPLRSEGSTLQQNDMNEQQLGRLRPYLTAVIFVAELGHLAWEHFSGGVVSHNILNRPDLPAISNWWGALLLPLLTWFVIGRLQKRAALRADGEGRVAIIPVNVYIGFVGSFLFGIILAVSFAAGFREVTSYLFLGMLLLALLLPVYRAECVLGFVLGMTLTFGAVLPTAIGSIIAGLSASVGFVARRIINGLVNWFKRTRSAGRDGSG